jgi:hypothetical protein
MLEVANPGRCEICGVILFHEDQKLCRECNSAFESEVSGQGIPEAEAPDLAIYSIAMFPWENADNRVYLIKNSRIRSACVVALVILIILLAMFRTPLPNCWEISS